MGNQIIQSIKTIAQSLVDKAGYDKTRGGFIVGVNSVTNTYSVKVDGVTYPIVRAVDDATYNIGDVVKVVIPCNQATQIYIASSVLSDNSLGNKIANAVGLAQDAKQLGLDNQTEINNLDIVGINLLLNSEFKDNVYGWDTYGITDYIVKDGKQCAHMNFSVLEVSNFVRQSILGKLEPDTQYTMSGWVLTENVVKGTTNFACMFYYDGYYDNNGSSEWYSYGSINLPINAGEWTHVEWTFTTDSTKLLNSTASDIYLYARDMTGDIYFYDLKLEKGDKATDWTPAPDDVANAAKVATNFLGYDSTNGLIIGNKTSGAWSGYRSQILPDSFNILDESSTVLASFGTTTVIGEEAKANMHLTFNNLSMVDKNRAKFFEVGDSRNADGIATLQWSSPDVPIGTSGSTTITVGNTISSIVSVSVDSVELSSSSYSFSGDEVTINNLTASSEKYIEIIYKTTDPVYYLTFGSRLPSAIIGERSVAEGRNVKASGFASHAEGVGTSAIGAYSHAEGHSTKAKAAYSHAGGYQTVADSSYMTAIGTYNTENSGKAFVVGVGDFINRRDGFTVDWDGNVAVKGNLVVQGGNLVVQGDNLVDKIQNMFCTSYPETLTVTAGTFTNNGCSATLVGNNLRLFVSAKAKAAITAGNIKNQTMLTITFVDNKIGTLYSVSGSGGASGPNSQIYFDTSSSGGQHTITVTLAAIAQNLASGGIIDAYVSIPCRLKWDAY